MPRYCRTVNESQGNTVFRRLLLLFLCIGICLRAFALPLSMPGHSGNAGETGNVSIAAHGIDLNSHSFSDCHDVALPDLHAIPDASPEKSKICQILCDIGSAPLLIAAQLPPSRTGIEVQNPSGMAFSTGINLPPDHPPPIA